MNAYAYVAASPLNYRDPNGLVLDTVADVGFVLYDVYRILKDNVFGDCDNLGGNLLALGLDVVGAAVPFLTGLGTASRAARAADDVAEATGKGADDLADAGKGADDAADAAEDANKGADDVADTAEDAANGGGKGKGDDTLPPPNRGRPENPDDLLNQGYKETSHPDAAANGHRTFENPETGDKVRFDQGKPGAPGHEGQDHYHRYNPDSTGRGDEYLDKDGNPCKRGCGPSHLYPGD